jgi:hypothetical protein
VMRPILLALALTLSGCASAIVVGIDPVTPGWKQIDRLDCVAAGEQVRLKDGRIAVVLTCPDGAFIAVDRRTGRVIH